MFDIGFWELLVIGVLALLILGPERLPGAMRSTINTIRNVRNVATGFKQEVEHQLRVHELHENLKKAEHEIIADRIVAGTYIIAALMLNSALEINNFNTIYLKSLIDILKKMGAN